MNWDQLEGKWMQLKGKVKARWGELTDNDIDTIHGRREELVGLLQQRYGIAKEEAEKQIGLWATSVEETLEGREPGSRRKASYSRLTRDPFPNPAEAPVITTVSALAEDTARSPP